MKYRALTTALAVLLGSSATEKTAAFSMFGGQPDASSTGLIEMDMHIKQQPKQHLNDVGMHLMNLATEHFSSVTGHHPDSIETARQQDFIEKNLYTFYDIQLYSNIWIGSKMQQFEMIFDTGSSWVWVQDKKCTDCMANEHKFDSWRSTSWIQIAYEMSVLRYGKGTVYGYDGIDHVCIKPDGDIGNGCMPDYLFKTVVGQRELSGLAGAGIVGLSPSAQGTGAQLFVPTLFHRKAINRNMFAMFMDPNGQSKIQMGGYDLKSYAKGPLNWHKLSTPNFWQVTFGRVRMGNFTMRPSTNQAMVDSGTSLNMMPDEDFYQIYYRFFNGTFDCHQSPTTLTVCQCNQTQHESIPDLTFLIGNVQYRINRDQWFERKDDTCVIKFMHAPGRKQWILGLNFFTNYYTVFDYANNRIGFAASVLAGGPPAKSFMQWVMSTEAAHKFNLAAQRYNLLQSNSEDLVYGSVLTDQFGRNYQFYGICFAVILVFASMYYCFSKKSQKNKLTVDERVLNTNSSDQFLNDEHIAQL